jgi:hypothetical protein
MGGAADGGAGLGTRPELGHIDLMKLNSPKSIQTAGKVFRSYGSWTAAREAATHRDPDGVLVIPKDGRRGDAGRFTSAGPRANSKAK